MLNFAPDFGFLVGLLKWIRGLFVSPNVCLLDPEIRSREAVELLVLWQIPVQNQRRKFWLVSSAHKCTVDLEFFREGDSILKVEGRWDSDDGPIEHQDLHPDGRLCFVPVIVQAFFMGVFSPGMLRHTRTIVESGVVHVLGADFLIGGNNQQRLDPGNYELEVVVQCEGKQIAKNRYRLLIPQRGQKGVKVASHKKLRSVK